jgi:hypothetical protein
MVDQRYTRPELIAAAFPEHFIDDISARIMTSQFKRRLPVIAKVSQRTIDRDFRYSRDWGEVRIEDGRSRMESGVAKIAPSSILHLRTS